MERPLVDEEAERSVLGGIIADNRAYDLVADALEPSDFGREHHARVFDAMRRLHRTGHALDAITISAELERMGDLERVGRPFVYALGDGVPKSTNVPYYAAVVRDKSLLRRIRDAARRLIAEVEGNDVTGVGVLEQAEQAVYALGNKSTASTWLSGSDRARLLRPILEQLSRRQLTGMGTGFADLDRLTLGLQPGDLWMLGARPSQGKTAFGMQVARHAAKAGRVAVFSVEMSAEGISLREVVQESDVNGWRLFSGSLSDVDWQRVGQGMAAIDESKIHLDVSPFLTPIQVRSRLRRLRSEHGPFVLVVIDYLQLMAPLPEDRRENKTNQVAGISRALKVLAREFQTPFLVLSQLHRVPDNRRPTTQDLRDSGALEQDADLVLLLHRPEVYEPKPDNAGLAEVIIGKNRNGPTGIVELTWRGENMSFANRSYR